MKKKITASTLAQVIKDCWKLDQLPTISKAKTRKLIETETDTTDKNNKTAADDAITVPNMMMLPSNENEEYDVNNSKDEDVHVGEPAPGISIMGDTDGNNTMCCGVLDIKISDGI